MKRFHGFTLIELLATLSVMAIISAMLFPFYQNYTFKAKTTSTFRSLKLMQDAMMRYTQMNDDFFAQTNAFDPTSWGGTNALDGGPWLYDNNTHLVAKFGYVGDGSWGNRVLSDITTSGPNQTLKPSSEMFQNGAAYFYWTGPSSNPITNMNYWVGFYRIPNNVNGDYVDCKGNRVSAANLPSFSANANNYVINLFQ